MGSLQIPTNKLDLFIRSVEIASYLPGRIRLRSQKLRGNLELERQVQRELRAFPELPRVEPRIVTGSILLHYEPATLRRNPDLRKVEEYIMAHARR